MLISIIIPVYREQDNSRQTLSTLNHCFSTTPHEILVVDGEPGASTLAALMSGPAFGRTVRLLTSDRGRGPQMNAGAKAAMLHSDVTFEIAAIVQSTIFFLVTAKAIHDFIKFGKKKVAA